MAAYDQPLAFVMLGTFLILILLLIFRRLDAIRFGAAIMPTLVLFLYFSVGYRITEMSLASGTIKLASDQAQKYADQIKEVRDKVVEAGKSVIKVSNNVEKTDVLVAEISNKSLIVNSNLASISAEVTKSEGILADLKQQSEFDAAVSAAQADDRQAFEKLKNWATDFNFKFHARASAAWKTLRTQMNSISGMKMTYTINWAPNFDPSKLGLDALSQLFFQAEKSPDVTDFEFRSALLDYIASRQDISKDKRLDFLLKAMHGTNSTRIFAYAALDFNQLADAKSNDLTSIDFYDGWWRSHAHEQ